MHSDSGRAASGLPRGFQWGAVTAGIKASGNPDLAFAVAPQGTDAVAMFTRNQVVAAPVIVGRKHLTATGGRVAAVLVNAGNANCATGPDGLDGCQKTCVAAAEAFGCLFDEVFPSSTGIIGVPFPAEKIIAALPAAPSALGSTPEHAEAFARAILTTDTRMKTARAFIEVEGSPGGVHLFGAAKGAGMVHPRLSSPEAVAAPAHATMLVYLFTDVAASGAQLKSLLEPAVEHSFHSISIDGDTSTNDTVLLLASGASDVKLESPRVAEAFENALHLVCDSLAHQIVDDGEGVTHVVTLHVTGARNYLEARQVAETIAQSPLCKTAWSSGDPNWGRLLAAAGRSGVSLDPNRITIWIAGLPVFALGMRAPGFDEAATHAAMLEREYRITLDLGEGAAECEFLTCDLTAEYVRINADYSS